MQKSLYLQTNIFIIGKAYKNTTYHNYVVDKWEIAYTSSIMWEQTERGVFMFNTAALVNSMQYE